MTAPQWDGPASLDASPEEEHSDNMLFEDAEELFEDALPGGNGQWQRAVTGQWAEHMARALGPTMLQVDAGVEYDIVQQRWGHVRQQAQGVVQAQEAQAQLQDVIDRAKARQAAADKHHMRSEINRMSQEKQHKDRRKAREVLRRSLENIRMHVPSGGVGRSGNRVLHLPGEHGGKLARAKSQEQSFESNAEGKLVPDARPAAARRKVYRPQRLCKSQGPTTKTGMVSLMACLGLVMAMGAEGLTMAGGGAAAGSLLAAPVACIALASVAVTGDLLAHNAGKPVASHHIKVHPPNVHHIVNTWQDNRTVERGRWQTLAWQRYENLDATVSDWNTLGDQQQEPWPEDYVEPVEVSAEIAEVRRARFSATSTEVTLLDSDMNVHSKVMALLDSGAVMSCTPTKTVKGLRCSINREAAARLCTAEGTPLKGVQGEITVKMRIGESSRVFEVQMQVIDSDIPFILGMDFFKRYRASLNYDSKEVQFPPDATNPATAAPLELGGVSETVIAAVLQVPWVAEAREPHRKETLPDTSVVRATEDLVVNPGKYAHVDLRVQEGTLFHHSDELQLTLTKQVRLDSEVTDAADSAQEQAHIAQEAGNDAQAKTLFDMAEQLGGWGYAGYEHQAVQPWMDAGSGWVGVSAILQNHGCEPLVVRRHEVLGSVTRMGTSEPGPAVLPDRQETVQGDIAQIDHLDAKGTTTNLAAQFDLDKSDWRYQKSGREIIGIIQSDLEQLQEFNVWHVEWYHKLQFGSKLSQLEKTELAIILFAFRKVISLNPKAPSIIKGVEHTIPLDPNRVIRPHKGHLRRLSPAERQAQDEETKELLASGRVRPSSSPWAAGTVIVPKKDGGRRFAIDYRVLNSYTVADSHPLPRCDDILDAVGGAFSLRNRVGVLPVGLPPRLPTFEDAKVQGVPEAWGEIAKRVAITSVCDVAAGFHGVLVKEEDRYKTAFSTWGYGLLEWVVMPFGLVSAPATFQRQMQEVLRGLLWDIVIVYIDDIAIFSTGFEEHLDHLTMVLSRLDSANISIKISKCTWGTDTVPLLGHLIVAGEGVKPDASKVEALALLGPCQNTQEIKSFLGACSYYRRFIPNFAVLTEPLRQIEKLYTTKTASIEAAWEVSPHAQKSYAALKSALVNAPILVTPDFTKPFIIISDASKKFIGGVLAQRDSDGIERPIAYHSRALRGAELNYAITDAEGLALIDCVKRWRHYIQGSVCLCITDHSALTRLLKTSHHGSGRQARYALDLGEYDLQIVHRKGSKMHLADLVSRTPLQQPEDTPQAEFELAHLDSIVPLNPEAFATKLYHSDTVIGTMGKAYKDAQWVSELSACETITQALDAAEPDKEACSRYHLNSQGAHELLSQMHSDRFRLQQAYKFCKPADPDESRTIDMLDTICAITESEPLVAQVGQLCPIGGRASRSTAGMMQHDGESESAMFQRVAEEAGAAKSGTQGSASVDASAEEEHHGHSPTQREHDDTDQWYSKLQKSLSRANLIAAQQVEPKWEAMQAYKLHGTQPCSKQLQQFVRSYENLYECDPDGMVFRVCWRDSEGKVQPLKQLVVPVALQNSVIQYMHASTEGAHNKAWKTYYKTRERFWWSGMHKQIGEFVDQCPLCQLHGASQSKAPLAGHAQASRPGQAWVCDLIHYITSEGGHSYLLVCIDIFSKYAELVPLKGIPVKNPPKDGKGRSSSPGSKETAQAFMNAVVQHWGVPESIVTDGGSEFRLHFDEMCRALRTTHRLSTAHHPGGHGTVERLNRTVSATLAKLVDEQDGQWHTAVPWCQLAYNAAPQRSLYGTGAGALSPAEAHTGSRLHVSIEFATDPEALTLDMQSRTVQDAMAAREWINSRREEYEAKMQLSAANSRRRLRTFQVGDLVAVQYPDHDKLPQKLKEKYAGPYEVMAAPVAGRASYVLQRRAGGAKSFVVHIDRLKKYQERAAVAGAPLEPSMARPEAPTSRLYEVERILAHKVTPTGREYKVLWKPCVDNDFSTDETTWELEASLKCAEEVHNYHKESGKIAVVAKEVLEGYFQRHFEMASIFTQRQGGQVIPVNADLLMGDPTTMVQRICRTIGMDPAQVLLVWASTPCETFSRADASNITRGHHHRDHSNPERPPKSDDCRDLKVLKAMEHDYFLPRLQMMVAADRQRGLSYNFLFENPRASLRCRPYMQICAWPRIVQVVRRTVDLCAFGHVYKKGTDLWTSLTSWRPTGTTGDGRCHSRCGQGDFTPTGSFQHFHALGVESTRAVQGKGATAMRNAMPTQLLREILRAASNEGTATQRIVIDLCAGYRSLQEVCMQEGMIYVPVDIRYTGKEVLRL